MKNVILMQTCYNINTNVVAFSNCTVRLCPVGGISGLFAQLRKA